MISCALCSKESHLNFAGNLFQYDQRKRQALHRTRVHDKYRKIPMYLFRYIIQHQKNKEINNKYHRKMRPCGKINSVHQIFQTKMQKHQYQIVLER